MKANKSPQRRVNRKYLWNSRFSAFIHAFEVSSLLEIRYFKPEVPLSNRKYPCHTGSPLIIKDYELFNIRLKLAPCLKLEIWNRKYLCQAESTPVIPEVHFLSVIYPRNSWFGIFLAWLCRQIHDYDKILKLSNRKYPSETGSSWNSRFSKIFWFKKISNCYWVLIKDIKNYFLWYLYSFWKYCFYVSLIVIVKHIDSRFIYL